MMMRPLLDLIRGNIFKSEKYPTFPKEPNRKGKRQRWTTFYTMKALCVWNTLEKHINNIFVSTKTVNSVFMAVRRVLGM